MAPSQEIPGVPGRMAFARHVPHDVPVFSMRELSWGTLRVEPPRGRVFRFEGTRERLVTIAPADLFFVPDEPYARLGNEPISWGDGVLRDPLVRDPAAGFSWPSDKDLLALAATAGMIRAARKLGVSESAVRRRVNAIRARIEGRDEEDEDE